MKELKVWGGHTGKAQRRTIVAAYTKREAVAILSASRCGWNISRYHFDGYWSETGNQGELKTATEPGVWVNTAANMYVDKPIWVRQTEEGEK